jgi:flagellar hook-associated protein 3 FlgL
LINQLISIAAETSNGIPSSQSSSTFVQQVQSIQQQMINLANTSVQGRYIFGGDQPTAQPYSYTPGSGNGYVQNTTPSSTATLMNADGSSIVPRMTAAAIFDNSSSGSVLQAISSLSSALSSNNAVSVQIAGVALKSALAQVEQATTFYGNVENWIQQSQQQSVEDQNALTQDLSQTKDTDMAAAATQLSLDQTALQAALAAHGSLSIKSLFDYLG